MAPRFDDPVFHVAGVAVAFPPQRLPLQNESERVRRTLLLQPACDRYGRVRIARVNLVHRFVGLGRKRDSSCAGRRWQREERGQRGGEGATQKSEPAKHGSYFTLLSQPASHAAVTYIAKHSSANGMKPINPGAGISKIFQF